MIAVFAGKVWRKKIYLRKHIKKYHANDKSSKGQENGDNTGTSSNSNWNTDPELDVDLNYDNVPKADEVKPQEKTEAGSVELSNPEIKSPN